MKLEMVLRGIALLVAFTIVLAAMFWELMGWTPVTPDREEDPEKSERKEDSLPLG